MKQNNLAVGVACGLAIGISFGLVVGTMAGVLFAPARGVETRRRLRYEREQAVNTTRSQVRRTMARLHLVQPESGEEEEDGAFPGA